MWGHFMFRRVRGAQAGTQLAVECPLFDMRAPRLTLLDAGNDAPAPEMPLPYDVDAAGDESDENEDDQ